MVLVGILASILVGLVPAALYGSFIYGLDWHEKEPWWILLLVFLWGAGPAALMALIAQLLLDIPTTWVLESGTAAYEIFGGSFWAPITEEICKALGILIILVVAPREVDSVLDGIIYGAMSGLGFAFSENVLYFSMELNQSGWGNWASLVLLRTIPFGLNHALFSGIVGGGAALALLSRKLSVQLGALPCSLIAGMAFHSVHNLGVSLSEESFAPICISFLVDWGGIFLLGVIVILIWQQEKRWIKRHLPGEVSPAHYRILISWRKWQGAQWNALLRGDIKRWRKWRRFRQLAIELAFKKYRFSQSGPNSRAEREIAKYRSGLAALLGNQHFPGEKSPARVSNDR